MAPEPMWPLKLGARDPVEYARRYEHGNCGLVAFFARSPSPGRRALDRTLEALRQLSHRSGFVHGEGDGCGVLTDIPRGLWARRLEQAGHDPARAHQPWFAVAHLFVFPPQGEDPDEPEQELLQRLCRFLARHGIEVLTAVTDAFDPGALGPRGRRLAPRFWQLGLWVSPEAQGVWPPSALFEGDGTLRSVRERAAAAAGNRLFEAAVAVERAFPRLHVVSMSAHTAVYKVLGDARALESAYEDLQSEAFESRAVIGHNRYSTNTTPTFDRAQPFSLLAHNGEINTIRRLVMEAEQIGVPTVAGGSDSQNLNRTADALIHRFGFTLAEAMEILFPPILNEIKRYPAEFQEYYMYFRQAWGPFAQGPAAILARHRDEAVMATDALGLRPLWLVPAREFVVFSSEPGVVPTAELVDDPRPLGPGEKVGVTLERGGVRVLSYPYLQERIVERWRRRLGPLSGYARFIEAAKALTTPSGDGSPMAADTSAADGPHTCPTAPGEPGEPGAPAAEPAGAEPEEQLRRLMAAWAWQADDAKMVEEMAEKGAEPIGSLGYDAPLAALSSDLHNLADYFKETVAVVTNPAIDREREIEHFSTRVVVGRRPPLGSPEEGEEPIRRAVELLVPLLVGGAPCGSVLKAAEARRVAAAFATLSWDDLLGALPSVVIATRKRPGEPLPAALQRISRQACEAVSSGVRLVALDDGGCFEDADGATWIDPHLAVAAVDGALRRAAGLRRRAGLVLRSGALRNLHDVMLALGLGADAVNPWMMVELAARRGAAESGSTAGEGVERLVEALRKGAEKVISTLGIHELRGYARLFSCIGLAPELVRLFEVEGYAASEGAGVGFARLEAEIPRRRLLASGAEPAQLVRPFRYWPRIWKAVGAAARGEIPYGELAARMEAMERETPVALRHVLGLRRPSDGGVSPDEVDVSIGEHSLPFVISSMSFGSQGERAYRAYLEAAVRANIVCLNGEGGEIGELVGRYPRHRGIQVASGRFGVHAEMLNGAWVIEIKIGQGAKPGEGGHLPGRKVSAKVARARNAQVGIDLISPSNNHDIYSIEDLAQLIHELRAVSPHSRIAVKVPVVPGIGTIGVGIVKAGADIVNLSGFDGGTGAARQHAIRHVGLPAEPGIVEVHRALVAAGLRDRVEIWADGGMRSALDAMKCILLGANRIGFGTLAMVAIGCTICRGCQLDTCHVGIATQIEDEHEAMARGLKRFVPRDVDRAADELASLLQQMGQALRELTAQLGARRTQDLVGRSDLLEQVALFDRIDLRELLEPARVTPSADAFRRPVVVALGARTEPGGVKSAWAAGDGDGGIGPDRPAGAATVETREGVAAEVPQATQAGRNVGAAAAVAVDQGTAGFDATEARGREELVLEQASCCDRVLATPVAGQLARWRIGLERPSNGELKHSIRIAVRGAAAVGNGAGAFNVEGVELHVEGGAQDGTGKCALGGRVVILKGIGAGGRRVNGAVGKSFAYGAQRGRFFVQGEADSRAAIRLSGADVVFGAMPRMPVDDSRGHMACTAQLKGFAFEYMTAGRVVVLGDPGPWICSGMTGGVVYLRLAPHLGLDEAALRRRIAKGAKVRLGPIDDRGEADIRELLGEYAGYLRDSGQHAEAAEVERLAASCRQYFVAVRPAREQVDPHISTE